MSNQQTKGAPMIKVRIKSDRDMQLRVRDPDYILTEEDLFDFITEMPAIPRLGDRICFADGYEDIVTNVRWKLEDDGMPTIEVGDEQRFRERRLKYLEG